LNVPNLSVVIPTHNRAQQVFEKVSAILSDSGIAEVIVVVDGSTDDTCDRLRLLSDDRLRIISNATPVGPSRARNAGVAQATGDWVALLDDDDFHSDDFFTQLWTVADLSGAAIVGTAWLHFKPGVDPTYGFQNASRSPTGPSLSSPSVVPQAEWAESLWLLPNILVKRSVFDHVKFDEGYRGNYWREETDFFVSVARAGHKVVVTNRAYSYQFDKPAGGINRSNRLIYEFWVIRNNLRFMKRHGAWLKAEGHILSRRRFVLDSVSLRLKPLVIQTGRKLLSARK
jgi:glycosyltransferase involved in cell wall biosynthesis